MAGSDGEKAAVFGDFHFFQPFLKLRRGPEAESLAEEMAVVE